MKKLIVCFLMLIFLSGCGCSKKEEEVILKTEEEIYLEKLNENNYVPYSIYVENENKSLDCPELTNDIKYLGSGSFLTSDGRLFIYSSKLYSNDKNCKEVSADIKIEKILNSYSYYDIEGNRYSLDSTTGTLKKEDYKDEFHLFLLDKYKNYEYWDYNDGKYMEEIDTSLNESVTENNTSITTRYAGGAYCLRNGKVYFDAYRSITTYSYTTGSETVYKLTKSIVVYDGVDFSSNIMRVYSCSGANYKNNLPVCLKTENKFYSLKVTNAEECGKYADVECIYEMKSEDILTEYYSKIGYFDGKFIIDTNNKLFARNGY